MMRALDLFCCAGGASDGLAAAGFHVTGVDIKRRANYPYDFIEALRQGCGHKYQMECELK
jgi:site-specific DNA-cytosine methylase